MKGELFPATDRQPGGDNNFHGPDIRGYGFRRSQFDFAEYNRDRKIGGSLRFCQPIAQGGQGNSILAGESSACKATAPELLNHLQTLIWGCSVLSSGNCFDFHERSVARLAQLR